MHGFNKVQLITYPDSLGTNLAELHYVLMRYLKKAVSCVHILPFYPSSADRGFAPLTYTEVDEKFGTWEDVEKIGEDFELMLDFMVNHISRQSVYFRDYVEKGVYSEYADMFLGFVKLSPDGELSEEVLGAVYTRKPGPPYTVIERADGSSEKVWSTFGSEQIDVDIKSPVTRHVFRNFLIFLARRRPSFIRMDAFAYTTVEPGTRCFFQEPRIWEILDWLSGPVHAFGAAMLAEVHEHYAFQMKLSRRGYWVYDFALPMLVLHALYNGDNGNLVNWLAICPRKQITTLDTHDGMGVVDVAGLMTREEIDSTIDTLYKKGSNANLKYSGEEYHNLDIYQINCTYYSALGCSDDAYIAARVIQFFTPGVPQVYYVGLLAGENDIELVERTKNGRDINRHNYCLDEVDRDMKKPVVRRLLRLMEFRNSYPAFNGDLEIGKTPGHLLLLTWNFSRYSTTARVDLKNHTSEITYLDVAADTLKTLQL